MHQDHFHQLVGLSHEGYIDNILKRYGPENCSSDESAVLKDITDLGLCAYNDLERQQVCRIPYASTICGLIYARTCTHPGIAFSTSLLGRYPSNPRMAHCRAIKKAVQYLKRAKNYVLTIDNSYGLNVLGYNDANWKGCNGTLYSAF